MKERIYWFDKYVFYGFQVKRIEEFLNKKNPPRCEFYKPS